MNEIMTSVGVYLAVSGVSVLATATVMVFRGVLKKAEEKVTEILPQDEAVKVNDLLDAIDRLTEAAVQDANSRIVSGLKKQNLFTAETATSVKESVVNDVLKNLGPLKEKVIAALGPLESIISQMVEKYVLKHKTPA